MDEKLKPCPFCGSENTKVREVFVMAGHFYSECADCGISTLMCSTKKEVIEKWNRRVSDG